MTLEDGTGGSKVTELLRNSFGNLNKNIAESTSVRHGYIFHCNISSSSSQIVDLKLSYISWRQVTPLVLNMKTTCCEQNVVFIIHTFKKINLVSHLIVCTEAVTGVRR